MENNLRKALTVSVTLPVRSLSSSIKSSWAANGYRISSSMKTRVAS